jgi:phenylalanyl-tRNA synthetase beta chain
LEAVLAGPVSLVRETAEFPLGVAAGIYRGGRRIGLAGQVRPSEARQWDVTGPLVVCEVDAEALLAEPMQPAVYRELPRFPAVQRDIALVVPRALPQGRIAEVLWAATEPLLAGVELFDVFTDPEGLRVPADSKSLAYALTYRAADRTLTTEEVNEAHARLKQRVVAELGVTARE